jgi:hypothetical protein
MVDRCGENLPRPIEVAAGEQHALDLRAILGPLLDLVKIAIVSGEGLSVSSSDHLATFPIFLFELAGSWPCQILIFSATPPARPSF